MPARRTRTDTRAGRDYRSAGVSRHPRYPTPKHRSSGTTPALAHDRPSSVHTPHAVDDPMARVTSRISSASIAISNERRIEVTEAVEIQARHHLRSHSHARLRLTRGDYRYTLPRRVAGSRVRGLTTQVTKPGTLRAEEIRVSLHPTSCVRPDSEEMANRRTEIPRIASHQEYHHQREARTEFQRATSVRYGETHIQQHPPSTPDSQARETERTSRRIARERGIHRLGSF